jgi:hypothetical protein
LDSIDDFDKLLILILDENLISENDIIVVALRLDFLIDEFGVLAKRSIYLSHYFLIKFDRKDLLIDIMELKVKYLNYTTTYIYDIVQQN